MKSVTFVGSALCGLFMSVCVLAQCPAGGYGPPPAPEGGAAGPSGSSPSAPTTPRPAGPSAPKPTGPAAPAPKETGGPNTGGPNRTNPTTPRVAGPRTGARGIPLSFERGATAKERLKIDWLHPVPPERSGTQTSAAGPLSFLEALEVLWDKNDDRPLLVLRECTTCSGTDDALLSRAMNSDSSVLLTKWFRTVRLPAHVVWPTHAFFNVFDGHDFKRGTPHFFLLAQPGAKPVLFDGQQTQADLVKGMHDVLALRYAKDAKKAVKSWLSLLDKFDTLDARQRELKDKLGEVLATDGPDSDRAQKLNEQLARIADERAETLEQEKKVRDLGLLTMSRAALAAAGR